MRQKIIQLLQSAPPPAEPSCVCVRACLSLLRGAYCVCSSSVCTREWEKDLDVKLETEKGVDGGIRADVIRES